MIMFLRPKESLRLSIYFIRCVGFSNRRDFHLTHCAYLRNVSAGRRIAAEVRDYENSPSVAGEFSVNVPPKNVNDNFFGIESDEGVIEINSKIPLKNNARGRLFKNVEQEKIVTTSFGTVRYDSENKPKYHGQLEKEKVMVSSNVDKAKIHDLKKNSVENDGELSSTEKCAKTTTDVLDKNLKSKLASSSYVDELYFPETYTEEDSISKLEDSLSSSNKEKLNFIEESYFNDKIASEPIFKDANIISGNTYSTDKNYPLPDQEDSMTKIADHKLPSFQPKSGLKSSSLDNKSNFIEEFYFNDKMADEFISKNVNTTSESIRSTDKSHHFQVNEKTSEYIVHDEKSNLSSSTENLFNAQGIKQDMKALYNLNESVEKVDADDKGEQLSLKWNSPSLEDLGKYNKFMPNVTDLPKKKNNFLFQSEEFLKKSELIKSKNPSKVRKLELFQRNMDEAETAEIIQNEEEMVKNSSETQNSKIKKEVDLENSNANELPETAYDFVKKLRSINKKMDPELRNGKFIQKSELYDSKGFRILRNQVPDLSNYTRDEILELLVKNVLYSDDDLIVLNKPYNLVMHESKTAKDPCLSQYLDDLAAELDRKTFKPKLITVHRLDKETTGCLLLARNEISAQRLLSFFSQRKIIKTYWIVTTKVPDPLEGVIDMPISEGSINGRARMVLHPDLPKDIPYQNHSKSGKRAVTHYKVIAESGNAALVEAKPETGIKHQIRVHFGFGLSCPILGDHKYSHLDKLAPQKLQSDLLQRLHVRQSKVRHIPMHIYARSIIIPQYKDGRNLFVMAPMPTHMSKNLQRLKFRKN